MTTKQLYRAGFGVLSGSTLVIVVGLLLGFPFPGGIAGAWEYLVGEGAMFVALAVSTRASQQ